MNKISIPQNELQFTFARSGGPGGQNVNKVNSKVTLHWNFAQTILLNEEAWNRFKLMYANSINQDGHVVIVAQEYRSQKANMDAAIEKLKMMIAKSMIRPKARKKTKPKRSAVENRLQSKKKDSEKKQSRSKKHY